MSDDVDTDNVPVVRDDDPTPSDLDDASLRTTQAVLVDMSVLSSSIQQVQRIVTLAADENQITITTITAELVAVRRALLRLRDEISDVRRQALDRRRSIWKRRDETRVSVVGFAGALVAVGQAVFGQFLIHFAGGPMPPGFESAATVVLAGFLAFVLPADVLSRLRGLIRRKRKGEDSEQEE